MAAGNRGRWEHSYVLIVALTAVAVTAGLRCHSCKKAKTNEECNLNVAECTSSKHDFCYTQVERQEAFGKQYTKGCISYEVCKRRQDLNDARLCRKSPSDCWYCCNDKSTCNAYNSAPLGFPSVLTIASIGILNLWLNTL